MSVSEGIMAAGVETLDVEDELPLVPARMVNELLYCERLMYLEWVQGEWADNQYTVDGTWVHRRVDRPKVLKSKSSTDAPERPYQARAVSLSSAELGVTAKIDLVDVEGDRVMPIEYKRGRAPSVPQGAYLPERAQLCVHVLLLREHGYECDGAAIFFAAEQRRVPITIDAELERLTREAIARARELYRQTELPPPLMNSPKCRGCSLVGICLPDEVNQLKSGEAVVEDAERQRAKHLTEPTTALRRLHASRDEKEPLIVQEHGARVGLAAKQLKITSRDGQVSTARLAHTSHVVLYGNAQISTQATVELLRRG
ncbi:MAG: CRISPR-associated protein Cas4, partial [Myxococcales bacterium]|nr:CRISPR-associated protein Cas4 [Myxococcales bacterium]